MYVSRIIEYKECVEFHDTYYIVLFIHELKKIVNYYLTVCQKTELNKYSCK